MTPVATVCEAEAQMQEFGFCMMTLRRRVVAYVACVSCCIAWPVAVNASPRLDVFVVTSSWVELLVDLTNPGDSTSRANSNLRLMRLLRVGRLFRVVRIIRVVSQLQVARSPLRIGRPAT